MAGTKPAVANEDMGEFARILAGLWIDDELDDATVVKRLKHLWKQTHDGAVQLEGADHAGRFVRRAIDAGRTPKELDAWWPAFIHERQLYAAARAGATRWKKPTPSLKVWRAANPVATEWHAVFRGEAPPPAAKAKPAKAPKTIKPIRFDEVEELASIFVPSPNGKHTPDPGVASSEMHLHAMPTVKEMISAIAVVVAGKLLDPMKGIEMLGQYAEEDGL